MHMAGTTLPAPSASVSDGDKLTVMWLYAGITPSVVAFEPDAKATWDIPAGGSSWEVPGGGSSWKIL